MIKIKYVSNYKYIFFIVIIVSVYVFVKWLLLVCVVIILFKLDNREDILNDKCIIDIIYDYFLYK